MRGAAGRQNPTLAIQNGSQVGALPGDEPRGTPVELAWKAADRYGRWLQKANCVSRAVTNDECGSHVGIALRVDLHYPEE